jgi:hypothetical protein
MKARFAEADGDASGSVETVESESAEIDSIEPKSIDCGEVFGPPDPCNEVLRVAVSVAMTLPTLKAAWQVASIEKRRAFLAWVGEQDLRAALPDTIRTAWETHLRTNSALHERAAKKAKRQIKKLARERRHEQARAAAGAPAPR